RRRRVEAIPPHRHPHRAREPQGRRPAVRPPALTALKYKNPSTIGPGREKIRTTGCGQDLRIIDRVPARATPDTSHASLDLRGSAGLPLEQFQIQSRHLRAAPDPPEIPPERDEP